MSDSVSILSLDLASSKLQEAVYLVMDYPYKHPDSDCHRIRLLSKIWHHLNELKSIISELEEEEEWFREFLENKNEE